MKLYIILLLVLLINSAAYSSEINKERILWEEFNASTESIDVENKALENLIVFYENYSAQITDRDSIMNLVINLAVHSHDIDLLLRAYSVYFEGISVYDVNSKKHLEAIEQLADRTSNKRIEWSYLHFAALMNFKNQEFSRSIESDNRALQIARELGDAELELDCLLQIGTSNDWNGARNIALENYLQALDLARRENLSSYIVESYSGIAQMFFFAGNYDKSLEYRKKCLDLILSNSPVDTLWLINQKYKILEIQTNINFTEELEREIEEQIDFALKRSYHGYYTQLWTLYRSNLIENLRYGKLYQLYKVKYPNEFIKAKEESSDLYLRLKAYFHEYQGNLDSANYYWASAKTYIDETHNVYLKAHHHKRYAEFLIRAGDYNLASKIAAIAYKLSIESKFLDFQYSSLELLEEIDIKQKRYLDAYNHAREKNTLKEEIDKKKEQEGLLVMELQYEVERRSILQKKEEEAQQAEMRASQLKANAFGVGLVLFLVLSGVIFRQYRLTRKEKDRSDELLLNILPSDTALELKNTGQTTARQYNEVTVLFCDIVGFTKVAEQLSPQELVKEIDTYFRAFDDIIGLYGMEKIKTVGDAYVAVGGMPLYNEASAKDVVNAAIEMLKRVHLLSIERKQNNRPAFELRVGLHTGSVVAGVVGSKKFQFDIWGDAVNIAARMEQNSEPGKINISDVTYEAVKNDFKCTSRGKIEAKNKGMIDMFFVEFELG